jgi:hypothetical protein
MVTIQDGKSLKFKPLDILPVTQDDSDVMYKEVMDPVVAACGELLGTGSHCVIHSGQWVTAFVVGCFGLQHRMSIWGPLAMDEEEEKDVDSDGSPATGWLRDCQSHRRPKMSKGETVSRAFCMYEARINEFEGRVKAAVAQLKKGRSALAGTILVYNKSEITEPQWGSWFWFFADIENLAILDLERSTMYTSLRDAIADLQYEGGSNETIFFAFLNTDLVWPKKKKRRSAKAKRQHDSSGRGTNKRPR